MTPAELLALLGRRIRERRTARALSRRELAERAGVSLRFLASVEGGDANISVARLHGIAEALETSASELLAVPRDERSAPPKQQVIALLGLRGAGKSAVGKRVAARLSRPFVELDALVAERAGMPLPAIFELHGADYFRRLEHEALVAALDDHPDAIIATGGGIVTRHENLGLLQRATRTVWLKASAQDHWDRVVAQGDGRPMADRDDAMAELRSLLRARRALYEQAEHVVDTSSLGLERSVDAVVRIATA